MASREALRFTADEDELPELERPAQAAVRPQRAAVEKASEDVLIDRPDMGPGRSTVIRAGEPIPSRLAAFPRRPMKTSPAGRSAKQRRGKGQDTHS